MELKKILKGVQGKILWKEPLSKHTSFRVGGLAYAYIYPKDKEDLIEIFKRLSQHKIPHLVLGDGSNILVSDKGFQGAILNLTNLNELKLLKQNEESVEVYVGAGLRKQKLLSWAARKGFSGIEFLSGVPGQMGGGLFMNAGTYEGSFGDIVKKVFMIHPGGREEEHVPSSEDFSYRSQKFCREKIIVGATLSLKPGDPKEIRKKINEMILDRKSTQPLQYPNCGSTFMNPPGHVAGKLIELAGLKGYQVGKAMISKKHANFIINLGGARASDILSIIKHVEQRVKQIHGIELKREVVVIH